MWHTLSFSATSPEQPTPKFSSFGWYPRLWHGTPEERHHWRLIGGGEGIHWPELDEDISVENLLAGKPSGESQRSLKRWLEARAARGKRAE
jgi:hypothetical protein